MILDTIGQSAHYASLGPRFAKAFAWIASGCWKDLPAGMHDIEGRDIRVNMVRGMTKPEDQVKWEAHRAYADIQVVLGGRDRMAWSPLELCTLGAYDPEKDFQALQAGPVSAFVVEEGMFALFLPSDAHRPGMAVGEPGPLVKAVIKVRVDDGL